MKEELYYIQDTRQYVGNAVLWWGINGGGYTTDLSKAGKYSKADAIHICKRDSDKAWLCDYVDNNLEAHKTIIDSQYLDRKFSRKWKNKKINYGNN